MSGKMPLKDVLKVEQPILSVETKHVDVIQAAPAEDVVRAKQLPTVKEDAEALYAKSSRDINLTWEFVQAFLAIIVVTGNMIVFSILAIYPGLVQDNPIQSTAMMFLSGIGNLIIGFYFGRTNHTRSSGGGKEETR